MIALDAHALTDEYYASLSNTAAPHGKCVVLFSGVPGSGKSRVAHAIEKDFEAICISNDVIRDLIVAVDPTITIEDREQMKLAVATELLGRLEASPNGRIVFDASCDRPNGYDFYQGWAQTHDYPTVLLRMDIPRAVIEQRIRQRGDSGYRSVARLLERLDLWWQEWEASGQRQQPDLTITPDTSIESIVDFLRRNYPND